MQIETYLSMEVEAMVAKRVASVANVKFEIRVRSSPPSLGCHILSASNHYKYVVLEL
ncbi:hypothetical protein V6Z11_A11G210600 [Gossypium hirsutum]